MISKTWTSWEQSHEYQTKMRGEWLRSCGQWCERQQRDQEGKGMILFVILLHCVMSPLSIWAPRDHLPVCPSALSHAPGQTNGLTIGLLDIDCNIIIHHAISVESHWSIVIYPYPIIYHMQPVIIEANGPSKMCFMKTDKTELCTKILCKFITK